MNAMVKRVTSTVEKVNAQMAEGLLSRAYDRQQTSGDSQRGKGNLSVAKRYARLMREDKWLPGLPISVGVLPSGQEVTINGHQRANAVIESGTEQVFCVTRFEVDSMDDVDAIYRAVDYHRKRGQIEAIRSLLEPRESSSENGELKEDFDKATYARVLACVKMYWTYWMGGGNPMYAEDFEEAAREIVDWLPYYREYTAMLVGGDKDLRRLMARPKALSWGMLVLRFYSEEARRFIAAVVNGYGESASPEKALHALALKGKLDDSKFFEECVKRWNLSTTGRKSMERRPYLQVVGTPYTGDERMELRQGDFVAVQRGSGIRDREVASRRSQAERGSAPCSNSHLPKLSLGLVLVRKTGSALGFLEGEVYTVTSMQPSTGIVAFLPHGGGRSVTTIALQRSGSLVPRFWNDWRPLEGA